MKGYIQVYTGDGKGKTTAALGLSLRAAGAKLKVFIAQFVKGIEYSELEAIKRYDDFITLKQYGRDSFIHGDPKMEDFDTARKGFDELKNAILSGEYSLVVIDEANIAIYYKLFSVEDLISLIDKKPGHVEIVITGRKADPKIIERADLVTEMKEIRHYYNKGVKARKGIEN